MSKTQSSSVYRREILWVQPNPRHIHRQVLGETQFFQASWMFTSVCALVIQTGPRGNVTAVMREDGPYFDFRPGEIALADAIKTMGLDPNRVTTLAPEAFDEFVIAYSSGVSNIEALQKGVPIIERHAPSMTVFPRHLHHLLKIDQFERSGYRHLPRMFMRYDLTDYEVIVWIEKSQGQISPKAFPKWNVDPTRLLHLGGAWYAFPTLEEAVTLKVMTKDTEIHRIREEA